MNTNIAINITDKLAATQQPVQDLIRKRWSPRAFSSDGIATEDLQTILEAASWAASANNEQPWRYFYGKNGQSGFDTIFRTLMPGNQPWAKNAAVLLVSVARKTFAANGKPNPFAQHDVGMANAQLLLQAAALNIYGHAMGGFDKETLRQVLHLPEDQEPVCVIALGYKAPAETLEEPYLSRELAPRTRKPLTEISCEVTH